MNFNNTIPDWENEGTAPSENLRTTGFQGGYKPPASVFNYFWSKVTKAITEIQTKLSNFDDNAGTNLTSHLSNTSNPHNVTAAQVGASPTGHTHDDRYYTESEIDTKLTGKANSSHSHNAATTSASGFMSSTDKSKLDGIATGANKTVVDSSLSSTSTNPVQNKVINSALAGKAASSHTHSDYLAKSGGTMTGSLVLNGEPTTDLQAATKSYVDNLAPLVYTTSELDSDTAINAAIEAINNQETANAMIIDSNGLYYVTFANVYSAIFACIMDGYIYTINLVKNATSIEKTTQKISTIQRTVTLPTSGWTKNGDVYTQTATVSGVSATETEQEIHITPATASMSAYMEAGVYASGQATNQITFTASEAPTDNLMIYVIIRTL